MSHYPSSPAEYRIDPSLEYANGSLISISEGPGPSRPYRCISGMQAHPPSTPASMPQTPLGPPAFLGGFAPPYDAYTHHLSQEISRLARENSELKIQLETTMKNYDMLLAKFDDIASHSNHPTCRTYKPDPPALHSADHPFVRFWRRSAYDQFLKHGNGETDGLATTKPRRGRPSNDESGEKHPYLETKDGTPVDNIRLRTIGDRTRQHFTTFQRAKVAPPSWGQLDHDCFTYFRIEMYTEFEEFRYCEDHWKLNFWAQRKYTSWSQTIRKRQATSDEGLATKKCKIEAQRPLLPSFDLDDPTLTTFDDSDRPATPISSPVTEIPPQAAPPIQAPVAFADPLNNIEFMAGSSLTIPDEPTGVIPTPSNDSELEATSPGPAEALSADSDITSTVTVTMQEVTNIISTPPPVPPEKRKWKGKGKAVAALAVVGAGFTEKNFAMKQWLVEYPGGLKCDFEIFYRGLASTEKKVYNDQAKAAKKAATAQKQGK